LNSLLTAANNKTGESDTTLTDAVQTLIDGYGQGGGGTGYYNIASGDIYALFDQYATENRMTKIDVTIPTDATSNTTVQHNLGYVPTEALLYPKNPVINEQTYQIGWTVDSQFAVDKNGNRTYMIRDQYAPSTVETKAKVEYPTGKTIVSLVTTIVVTAYNFTQSQPTSTTIAIRGGTQAPTKLLAGEYVLALK
jgi:hypothetical protein